MLRRLIVFAVVTVGILAAAFFGLTRHFTVSTNAMDPALESGDHVGVFRYSDAFTSPGRKDIVVLKPLALTNAACFRKDYVARIIGMPGETVVERAGVFSVDGKLLAEPYVSPARRDNHTFTWHVGQKSYLVAGDNRRSACAVPHGVPRKDVVGPVFFTYWPFDRISVG